MHRIKIRITAGRCADICGILSGLLFIVSSLTKAVSAAQFAQTIVEYGFPGFQFLSPVIIIAEMVLGLFLIFGVYQKRSALAAAAMITVFTGLFTYAHFIYGITDCGCFGGFRAFNKPVFLYVKNAVLLILLIFVFLKSDRQNLRAVWLYTLMGVAVCATAFASGYTYEYTSYKQLSNPIAVKDSPLKDFIEISPDSTYAVFVFSYTCPHCMNSVGNLKDYEYLGVVDRVIGLGKGDSVQREHFFRATAPNFTVYSHGPELFKVTTKMPRLFYISGDSIRMNLLGEAPAAYILHVLAQ